MRKQVLFLCLVLPLLASAQTSKQKVLYMKAVRSNGSTSARLEGTEGFIGPIYNPKTKRLFLNGTYRTMSTIKELRFEIKEEEIPDGIETVEDNMSDDRHAATTYDLGGRRVDEHRLTRGIYIRGGKKIVKQ